MEATGRRDTAAEVALRSALHRLGLRFRVDQPPIPRIRRRADIVFRKAKVAVFVDGCFWHGCPDHGTWPRANASFWRDKIETNRRRDVNTDRLLREAGWQVLRFWEHDDVELAARVVERNVRQGRSRSGTISSQAGQGGDRPERT